MRIIQQKRSQIPGQPSQEVVRTEGFGDSALNFGQKIKRRGSMLVEATVAMSLLVAIAIILLKASLDVMVPRAWVIKQNLADAYLTTEVALGNGIDFDVLTGNASPWPVYPASATVADVQLGVLDMGVPVTGTLTRTRIQQFSPGAGPMLGMDYFGIQMWELQSHLTYSIGGRDYVKSRSMIRTQ